MAARSDCFDWSGPDVVINHRDAAAVYLNPDGDVVIRQESPLLGMDDPFVVIPEKHVFDVVETMLRLVGYSIVPRGLQPFENTFDAEPPKRVNTPKPMTDAERARRYRERKRHEQPQDSRDAVTDRHDEIEPELKLATGRI